MSRTEDMEVRFWSKVDYDPHDIERCWPWTGVTQRGYGAFRFYDVNGEATLVRAHRQAYILHHGEMEPYSISRVELDHLCHDPQDCLLGNKCPHRRCCNPYHLKLATAKMNGASDRMVYWQLQKTHCPSGHPYDPQNTHVRSNGHRTCRTCNRLRVARYNRRSK